MQMTDQKDRQIALLEHGAHVSQTGAWYWDTERDSVQWSRTTLDLFGVNDDTDPLTLETALGFFADESRARLQAAVARCAADGTPYDMRVQARRRDGTPFWARAIGTAQADGAGRIVGLAGSIQDISDTVAAEEGRDAAQAELDFVMRTMPDGFFMLDGDWRFTYVNEGARTMLQRDPAQLVGQNVWEAFPEAVGSAFERQYRMVRETGQTAMFVEYFAPLDIWFEVSAHPTRRGVAVHFRDVSRRMRERQQLRLFRTAVDRLAVGVAILQGGPGQAVTDRPIGYTNAAMADCAGAAPDALLQHTLSRLLEPAGTGTEAARHLAEFSARIGQGTAARLECRLRRLSDDRLRNVILFGTPLLDDGGAITHVVLIVEDVTDRREAEAEARRSERLALLGQMAGGVSHDFNNLLAVIMGNVELLGMTDDPEDAAQLRHEVIEAVARGKGLNDSLLAFAGRAQITPRSVDLGSFVRGIEPLMRRALPSSILLEVETRPGLPPVILDQAMAESCVLNLVLNARAALPEGGRIAVAVDETQASSKLSGNSKRWITLTVADNGEGIPPELHETVFDPFYSTRPVGQGSGLGLSRVRGYVEQVGGFVALESRPGHGTRIALHFPVATIDDRPEAAKDETGTPHGNGARILLVDDNRAVAQAFHRMLRSLGYSVRSLYDPAEALSVFQTEGPFDAVVTDVVMPGMSGLVLARAIRRMDGDIPVLMISGYPDRESVAAPSDERLAFLEKPVSRAQLARSLNALL